MKKKQVTCWCDAYPFPHRQGGGKCEMPEYCGERSYDPQDCQAPDVFCYYHTYDEVPIMVRSYGR